MCVEMVDCKNPKKPIQFRSGIVIPKEDTLNDASRKVEMLGRSFVNRIMYRNGMYANWPDHADKKNHRICDIA